MWTEITRRKYEREGQRYASDLTEPGSGRPKGIPNRGPAIIAAELRHLADEIARLHQQRRDEHEALPVVLRRLTAIERRLGLTETPQAPRASRRHPMGA